jgi:uncharacterized protein involved in type VI secretion and phage assembly
MDSLKPKNPASSPLLDSQVIQTSVTTADSLATDKKPPSMQESVQMAQTGIALSKEVANRQHQQSSNRSSNGAPVSRHTPPPPALVEEQPARATPPLSVAERESVYEQTVWQILVDGKHLKRIASFQLNQALNAHQSFSLRVYHAELEEPRTYRIDQTKNLLGKTLTAILGSNLQDDRVEFTGLITGVSFEQANGLNGEVVLTGYSSSILLDNGPHWQSFYKQDIASIARTLTKGLSGKLEVDIRPRYQESLNYAAQYGESGFDFLNRLCSWFGEWLYFNGRKLCVGKPDRLPHYKLYYARQVEDLRMEMQAVPVNFTQMAYLSSDDTLLRETPPARVAGLNFYGDLAVEKSGALFGAVRNKPFQRAGSYGALAQAAKVNKAVAGASTFTMRGTCKVPYLSPGCRITILMGETQLGDYLVTAVEHHLSTGSQYTSTFTAVGGDVEIVPTPVIKAPAAEAELAVVRHNDDPQGQGRVRVQFQWQEQDQYTDWIRVMSPDAGGGGDKVAKNRGFVFIPEVGDLVMVAYRDGNPDAPFVLGSMHHGKIAGGGGKGNKTKGLTTRSGSTVTLDDEKGSVTVSDPSGNTVILHGDGTMTIHAPNKLTLSSKEIHLLADNDLNLASANAKVSVSGKSEIAISSGGKLSVTSQGETTLSSEAALKLDAPTLEAAAKAQLSLQGAMVNLEGKAVTNVKGGIVNIN